MPKKEAEELIEQIVAEQSIRAGMPVIRARVIYLGAMRNKSVAMPGSILIENYDDENGPVERTDRDGKTRKYVQLRKVVDGGITSYDFASHDVKGNLVRSRLMPDSAPERLRGKVFCFVEHPLHLAEFYLGPKDRDGKRLKEFEVMAKAEDVPAVQEYVKRLVRGQRQELAQLEEVVKG